MARCPPGGPSKAEPGGQPGQRHRAAVPLLDLRMAQFGNIPQFNQATWLLPFRESILNRCQDSRLRVPTDQNRSRTLALR